MQGMAFHLYANLIQAIPFVCFTNIHWLLLLFFMMWALHDSQPILTGNQLLKGHDLLSIVILLPLKEAVWRIKSCSEDATDLAMHSVLSLWILIVCHFA